MNLLRKLIPSILMVLCVAANTNAMGLRGGNPMEAEQGHRSLGSDPSWYKEATQNMAAWAAQVSSMLGFHGSWSGARQSAADKLGNRALETNGGSYLEAEQGHRSLGLWEIFYDSWYDYWFAPVDDPTALINQSVLAFKYTNTVSSASGTLGSSSSAMQSAADKIGNRALETNGGNH